MNKQFHFKLQGLLKLREFREKKIKQEIGEILKSINEVEDKITFLKNDIDEAYKAQEAFFSGPTTGQMAKFFPLFIRTKRSDVANNELDLDRLRKEYQKKISELAIAKGEVKVLENLKEKKEIEFKKEIEKKWQENLEELIIMRRARERGKA